MRKSSEASLVRHVVLAWLAIGVAGCDAAAREWVIEPEVGAITSAASACAQAQERFAVPTDNPRCPDGTYRGDVVLTESQVDPLRGCVHIEGDVRVAPSLVSLPALANLECVTGDVVLGPDTGAGALRDLRGLEALRSVRTLRIQNLPELVNLQGLSALEAAERIEIRGCESLASLDGLAALREVRGRLRLARNATFVSLSGAPQLRTLGELVLDDNPALEDLQGLPRELSQLMALSIERNASLLTLDGVEALTDIRYLFVSDNPRLERLAYFQNLRHVETLEVADHPQLTELGALPALEDHAELELTLRNNTRLASLHGLEPITQAYNVSVTGNAALSDLSAWRIQHVHNFMALSSNDSLTSLDGLGALRDAAWLRIQANPRLRDLDALSQLQRGGVLELRNNLSLRP